MTEFATRYDPDIDATFGNPYMLEHAYGDYVTYEDYETLHDLYVDLVVKLKGIEEKVKELYLDF